ncbi:MAG TPA: hydroxyacid dehydrogenase [Burkholderiales bacterium]|nr:hydroxyacid dehydrogenase [Burkholderiales bacterium]
MPAPEPRKTVVWFDDGKRPNVADLLEKEPGIVFRRLSYDAPQAGNRKALSAAHVYCISSTRQEMPEEYRCGAEMLARCPGLLAVSTSGAGYDTVDAEACTAAGVLLVNQSGANADAVAEHAAAMMLSLAKNIPQTDRSLRSANRLSREHFKGWNARGRTVGIVGIGNTGRRLARICGPGLQMKVLAYDPYLTAEEIRERGATKVDLATLLAQSRFVSVHCPYNAETRNMIGGRELAAMQPGAYLVTTARGGVVDEDALAAALESGHLAGAGVDVWNEEPPPAAHRLLALDNVIATHHTAGITHDSRENMRTWNAQQVLGILRGERPPRLVNPAAWPRFARRFEQTFGTSPEPAR